MRISISSQKGFERVSKTLLNITGEAVWLLEQLMKMAIDDKLFNSPSKISFGRAIDHRLCTQHDL